MLCEQGREMLEGIELADSLSLDPHKWLFQPFETGCVLVRNGEQLRNTFRILPDYLQDVHRNEEELNFTDLGIQLTRSFRALKVWLSFKVFGISAFREAIARGFPAGGTCGDSSAANAGLGDRQPRADGGGLFSIPARR